MMHKGLPIALLTGLLILPMPAMATGSLTRTFVSSTGVDSNPCTIAQPCATFAAAYAAVSPNGIIAALDPGKYGPLNISGPVTINGNGWAAITAPANGSGITVNAGSTDKVVLNGLEVDGAGAAHNGIVFNSGGIFTVSNCVAQNFLFDGVNGVTGNGILLQPSSGTLAFSIINTTVSASANGHDGIVYGAKGSVTATGVIDHVVLTGNPSSGVQVTLVGVGGSAAVSISNGVASNNGGGIFINNPDTGDMTVSIDNMIISGNTTGVQAGGNISTSTMLGRSVVTGNTTGVLNLGPGPFSTLKDNRIYLNGTDGANTLVPVSTN